MLKFLVLYTFILSLCAFASEKYGIYDLQGKLVSAFEAEPNELPEKVRQVKSDNRQKKLYVSSFKKGKGSKPTSRYNFKTGAYIEASRKETFSLCPAAKTEGIWISEHSVALDEKNCLSVQTPNLAGTFRILFMENSGLTDTIQVLVEQSYIQMEDYRHTIYVVDTAIVNAAARQKNPKTIYLVAPGNYESMNYNQPLIVDKTKFTVRDAWYYHSIIDTINFRNNYIFDYYLKTYPEYEMLEECELPFKYTSDEWRYANERSKKEGLDTAYYRGTGGLSLDTSASGYRLPLREEWFLLMRAGASTRYYWGDEEDSLTVSHYAWVRPDSPNGFKPVAQLLPNKFGLYDMIGIANEMVNFGNVENFIYSCYDYPSPECGNIMGLSNIGVVERGYKNIKSFRLLRKTPKLHKLEKF